MTRLAPALALVLLTACGGGGEWWISEEAETWVAGWQNVEVTIDFAQRPPEATQQAFFIVGVLHTEGMGPVLALPKGRPPDFHYTLPAAKRDLPVVEKVKVPRPATLFAMYDLDANGVAGPGDFASGPAAIVDGDLDAVTLTLAPAAPIRAGAYADQADREAPSVEPGQGEEATPRGREHEAGAPVEPKPPE